MSRAFITIVRDPANPLGKQFTRDNVGKIHKISNVKSSILVAKTIRVDTHARMAEVLKEVSNDPQAAIVNSYFPGTEDGQEFVILSTKEAHKRLGIPQHDRHRQLGEHQVTLNGKQYPAFLRLKENMRPSAWVLFDRDVDEHTPQAYAAKSFEEWVKTMAKFIPGFDTITYILAASTSSRVLLDGKPVGAGNGHLWMKVENSDDIERFRNAALLAAIKAGVVWTKNRMSRTTPGTVVGHSLATIVDFCVLVAGRLVFVGMPVADANFVVAPQSLVIHQGTHDMLNTELVVLDDPATIRALTRKAGVEMGIHRSASGLVSVVNDLTLDTEIETDVLGTITVRAYLVLGLKKIRCQTPFRDSNSFAAFIALDSRGNPFVYDIGTNTTHRLVDASFDDFEPCDYEVIDGQAPVSAAPNPFEKFSLLGYSKDIEKQAGDEKMLLGNVAVLGQLTVFYADPNTGKTLIVIYLLIAAIRAGRVKAKQVFYINVDDNLNGLVHKLRVAEAFGFHMVADGHQGFKVTDFIGTLTEMIEQDQAHGVVIILDTLKKFSNLMDKAHTTGFNKILRRFVMKGGTVIALAHTNKKRDPDGKPIYAGTSDVVEDFDCAYLMIGQTEPKFADKKVVQFENIKRRGNVALTATYTYSIASNQTYDQLLASVEEIAEVQFLSLDSNMDIIAEKAIIHAIVDLIGSGTNTKMALADAAAARAGISKRKATQVLEKYTGTDPAFSKWTFAVKDRGAKVYALLPEFGAGTEGDQA
jgi:AAA domain